MAQNPADLRSALQDTASGRSMSPRRQRSTPTPTPAPAPPPPPEATASSSSKDPHYRPGRAGKANITGFFDPGVKRQLRILAAEKDTTIQALLGEALNDLFAKNGLPEIVEEK